MEMTIQSILDARKFKSQTDVPICIHIVSFTSLYIRPIFLVFGIGSSIAALVGLNLPWSVLIQVFLEH